MATEHLTRYRLAASLAAGKRVLDAGCGSGYGSALLAEAGAVEVIGIDIDREAVGNASQRFGSDRVRFEVADLLDAPPNCQFQLVVCYEVLEHVSDPIISLAHLARRLSPDGILICSVPNSSEELEPNPFHVTNFDLEAFSALLHTQFRHAKILQQHRCVGSTILFDGSEQVLDGLDPTSLSPAKSATFLAVCGEIVPELPPSRGLVTVDDDLKYWVRQGLGVEEARAALEAAMSALTHEHEELETSYRNVETALEDALNTANERMVEITRLSQRLAATVGERDHHIARADEAARLLTTIETAHARELAAAHTQSTRQIQQIERTQQQIERTQRELEATRATVSWRATSWMRMIRRHLPSTNRTGVNR
jgi:SAM-dependent methyltransferase/prefoldin subunit 5